MTMNSGDEKSRGYKLKKIEDCQAGDILDMGEFVRIDPRDKGQGPNTVNVLLGNGYHYTESAGARIRVWGSWETKFSEL